MENRSALGLRDSLQRQPQWVLLVFGVASIVGIGVALGYLASGDDVEVVVESLDRERRSFVDVVVLHNRRPRSFVIPEGECRVQEDDGRRGPFDVQKVLRVGQHLRLCPFTETKDTDDCVRGQRFRLTCRSAARVVAGRDDIRIGKRLWLEVRGKGVAIVAHVPLESYIDAVVRAEHPRAPFEAQRAQAIVARTFALHAKANPRHAEAAVCATTHCQVYSGAESTVAGPSAAHSSAGLVLLDSAEQIVPAYFHSTCGGQTLDADAVWPGTDDPAIVGIEDVDDQGQAWCRGSRYYRWTHNVSAAALSSALSKAVGRPLDAKTLRLRLLRSKTSWRIGDKKKISVVRGAKVHRVLGRTLGWDHILSPRFYAKRSGGNFRLSGSGLGHGVGLCQTGAAARAEAGQSAEVILQDYFPNLSLVSLDDVDD